MPSAPVELKTGSTWLVTDDSGRRVVHKRLADDCCPRGQLHPNIALRLQRLRELPVVSFVNLLGVERTERGIVMVSQYIDGTPFDQSPESHRARHIRELRLAIMSMHQHGMVHGAIKPANIIIEPTGTLRIIDPSPLLYDDPKADLLAIDALDPQSGSASDRQSQDDSPVEAQIDARRRQRLTILAVALGVMAIASAVALAIHFGT